MSKHELSSSPASFPAERVVFADNDTGWLRMVVDLDYEMSEVLDVDQAREQLAANDPTIPISIEQGLQELSQPYGRHARAEDTAEAVAVSSRGAAYVPRHAKKDDQPLKVDDSPALPATTELGTGRHRLRDQRRHQRQARLSSIAEKASRFLGQANRLASQKRKIGALALTASFSMSSVFGPIIESEPHELQSESPSISTAVEAASDTAMTQLFMTVMKQQADYSAPHVAVAQMLPTEAPAAPVAPAAAAPVVPKQAAAPKNNSWVCEPNVQDAVKYLREQTVVPAKLTNEGIAGLLGNAKVESGIIADRKQGAGMQHTATLRPNEGFGVFQLTAPSRQKNYIASLKNQQAPDNVTTSMKAQMDFAVTELQYAQYGDVWHQLTTPGFSARDNAIKVLVKFEAPRDKSPNGKNARLRSGFAEEILANMDRC